MPNEGPQPGNMRRYPHTGNLPCPHRTSGTCGWCAGSADRSAITPPLQFLFGRIANIDIAIGQGLDAAVKSALEIGPASRALEGQPADVRAAATQSVRDVLAPLVKGDTVPLGASIWIVTARAS